MVEPKHTPSPWRLEYNAIIGALGWSQPVLQIELGRVYSEYTSDSPELLIDNPADLSLILGAPDLLAAAKALCPSDAAIEHASEEWKRLHRAIKRAEGGA